MDQLREDLRSDRKADILQVEDLFPGDFPVGRRTARREKKHGEFVARMVERGYTERQVRRLVEWRVKQAGWADENVAIHIVDRRLNPGSSPRNRQRFLRRAKALVQGAVKKSSQDWTSRMSWKAARSAS